MHAGHILFLNLMNEILCARFVLAIPYEKCLFRNIKGNGGLKMLTSNNFRASCESSVNVEEFVSIHFCKKKK